MLGKVKDLAYRGIVKKEAEEIVKRIGKKEEMIAYLGGEKSEEIKIPNRKSAYELLYETLIEQLEESDAIALSVKKDLFIYKKKISILWEEFSDKAAQQEKIRKEQELQEQKEKVTRKLTKIDTLQAKLEEKKAELMRELQEIKSELGEKQQSEPEVVLSKEAVEEAQVEIQEEVIEEEINQDIQEEQKKEELTEEELKAQFAVYEQQLYGSEAVMQNEENVKAEDLIGGNF